MPNILDTMAELGFTRVADSAEWRRSTRDSLDLELFVDVVMFMARRSYEVEYTTCGTVTGDTTAEQLASTLRGVRFVSTLN